MFYIKILLIWMIIALTEVCHGIIRAKFLAPKVGDLPSRQIGVFTGSMLFFIITFLFFDWLEIETKAMALQVGAIWTFAMIAFEFIWGHFYFHFSWRWLINDFNIFKGRLLVIGMFFLFFVPLFVFYLKNA